LYSLSSAGNVCWAKPNHAFSHCQQFRQIFFRTGSRRPRRKTAATTPQRRDDRASRIASNSNDHAESYIWRGFQRIAIFLSRVRVAMRALRTSAFAVVPSAISRPSATVPKGAAFRAAQADLRKSARTFSAAANAVGDRRRDANGIGGDAARTRRRHARGIREQARRCRRASTPALAERARHMHADA
jgi:hypothetical protein